MNQNDEKGCPKSDLIKSKRMQNSLHCPVLISSYPYQAIDWLHHYIAGFWNLEVQSQMQSLLLCKIWTLSQLLVFGPLLPASTPLYSDLSLLHWRYVHGKLTTFECLVSRAEYTPGHWHTHWVAFCLKPWWQAEKSHVASRDGATAHVTFQPSLVACNGTSSSTWTFRWLLTEMLITFDWIS